MWEIKLGIPTANNYILRGKGYMILPYYKIEKTNEGKNFFFSNIGYFNFWDEYLIAHTEKSNGKIFFVLVNRPNTKFSGVATEEQEKDMRNTFADSVYLKKPEEMFEDFPELKDYEWLKTCSKYYKEQNSI